MEDMTNPRETLIHDALAAHKAEYHDLSETWRNLDAKAQGTVAISGIFLAGILAFIRAITETSTLLEQCLLTATTSLLTASVFFSLLALRLRGVTSPPVGKNLVPLIEDLLNAQDGSTEDRILNCYRDQSRMWNTTNRDIEEANRKKANHLFTAQVILFVAIACAAIVTLLKVWRTTNGYP